MLNLLCLVLVVGTIPHEVDSQALHFYNGSFYNTGEIMRQHFYVKGKYYGTELAVFEEIFDSFGRKAAFRVTKKDDVFTVLHDIQAQKRYLLRTEGGRSTSCIETLLPAAWNRNLMSDIFHGPDERDYITLRDILVLRSKLTISTRDEDMARGIYTKIFGGRSDDSVSAVLKWTLNQEYVPKDYYDYYGGKPKTTTKKPNPVPDPPISSYSWPPKRFTDFHEAMLAPLNSTPPIIWEAWFNMQRPGSYFAPTITIRVYNFDYIKHPIQHDLLQIPDGVRCEGYKNRDLKKPIYTSMRVFSFSVIAWTNKNKHYKRVSEGWLDANQKLYKVDYQSWSEGATPKYSSVIISGQEGVGYRIPLEKGEPCEEFSLADTSFDAQMIIDPQHVPNLTAKSFFTGSNQSMTLDYKKAAFKVGIPCHKWDVIRYDWPPGSSGVKTLWEWCLVDMTKYSNQNKTVTPVALEIHVLEAQGVPTPGFENLAAGDTYFYQFFNFNQTSPDVVQIEGFFMDRCYEKSNWTTVRFTLNETIDEKVLKQSAFLAMAQKKVAIFAGIKVPALRVGHIKAYNSGEKTYVQIVLLDRFPNTTSTMDPVTTYESIEKLKYYIRNQKMSFDFNGKSYLVTEMCKVH
uniref:Putative secreted protein n=1 Tax=Amblyomma triste TaxID=251400 RepID=A0A023G2D3_AMBTT